MIAYIVMQEVETWSFNGEESFCTTVQELHKVFLSEELAKEYVASSITMTIVPIEITESL